MADKIKYGLSNVYYAKVTSVSTAGVLSYASPKHIPGAVNLTLSPEGERNVFYADNAEYYVSESNNGYSGTLEMALFTDEFRTDILGETVNSSGVMVEHSNVQPAEFALLAQFEGDANASRIALFRCICGRPDMGHATKGESIEPQTETLNITVLPRMNDYVTRAKVAATATTAYNAWFTSVVSVS